MAQGEQGLGNPLSRRRRQVLKEGDYEYPRASKFSHDMSTSYSIEELRELLVTKVEFPDLELVKIEAHHIVPGVDSFLAWLEDQRSSNSNVPASPNQ